MRPPPRFGVDDYPSLRVRRSCRASKAFTLIELMIGLIIGVVFLLGLYRLLSVGTRLFRKSDASLEAVQSATFVTSRLVDDLRNLTVPLKFEAGQDPPLKLDVDDWYIRLKDKRPTIDDSGKNIVMDKDGDNLILYVLPGEDLVDAVGSKKVEIPKLKKVEFKLRAVNGFESLFQVERIEGADSRIFRESYVVEIQVHFVEGPSDSLKAEDLRTAKDKLNNEKYPGNLYYAQILVVGASTSRLESGRPVRVEDPSKYYNVPLVSLVYLDQVTEVLSSRGLGRYWNVDSKILPTVE